MPEKVSVNARAIVTAGFRCPPLTAFER